MSECIRCGHCWDDPFVESMKNEIESLRDRLAAAEAALRDAESDHQIFVALAGNELQMVTVNINAKALDCGLTPADKWDAESIMRVQDAVFDDMCGKNDGWALEADQLNAKIVRLETLLREAGDFMTPHAHADWKKKLEAAKAAGGGE